MDHCFSSSNLSVCSGGSLLNSFCRPAAPALPLRSVRKRMYKTAEAYMYVQHKSMIQQGQWACNTSSAQYADEHDHAKVHCCITPLPVQTATARTASRR